jgi:hypothetical protein
MAAPSLSGFASGRQVDDTGRMMLALIQWARMQAVNEGRAYRFHVDGEHGEFYVLAQDGSDYEAPPSDFSRRFAIPPQLTAKWIEPAADATGHVTIQTTGRTQAMRLQLIDAAGRIRELRCDTPGGVFQLADELKPGQAPEVVR